MQSLSYGSIVILLSIIIYIVSIKNIFFAGPKYLDSDADFWLLEVQKPRSRKCISLEPFSFLKPETLQILNIVMYA